MGKIGRNSQHIKVSYKMKNDMLFRLYKDNQKNQEIELSQIMVPEML